MVPELSVLREGAVSSFSLSHSEVYMPHLSLAYSDCNQEERERWAREIREDVAKLGGGCTVSSIEVWKTEGPENTWELVGAVPLEA
jgi:hypothetical protein